MPSPDDAQAPASAGAARLGLRHRAPLVAIRVLQFVVDLTMVALLTLIPMATVLFLPHNPDGSLGAMLITIPVVLGILVAAVAISWWYWALSPLRREGRTWAMGWLGLRVVRLDGSPPTGGELSLRWVLLLVDAMFAGLVGLVSMLLTEHTQRIGDLLAGTVVVRDPAEPSASPGPAPAPAPAE